MLRYMAAAMVLLLVSCESQEDVAVNYEEGAVLKTSREFEIPKSLKEKIKKDYLAFIRGVDPTGIESDEELTAQLPREFLEVDLYLRQLGRGALSANTVFRSPRGGGLVDLSDTVIGDRGSFFVKFKIRDPQNPEEQVADFHAYYLSEIKSRKIGDKVYGTGCEKLVDLTEAIKSKPKGFRVNAKEDRYLHTMAGTYLFVSYAMEKIKLAALRVRDTSIKDFECPGKN